MPGDLGPGRPQPLPLTSLPRSRTDRRHPLSRRSLAARTRSGAAGRRSRFRAAELARPPARRLARRRAVQMPPRRAAGGTWMPATRSAAREDAAPARRLAALDDTTSRPRTSPLESAGEEEVLGGLLVPGAAQRAAPPTSPGGTARPARICAQGRGRRARGRESAPTTMHAPSVTRPPAARRHTAARWRGYRVRDSHGRRNGGCALRSAGRRRVRSAVTTTVGRGRPAGSSPWSRRTTRGRASGAWSRVRAGTWRCVVVDDGSGDDTAAIAEPAGATVDPPVARTRARARRCGRDSRPRWRRAPRR